MLKKTITYADLDGNDVTEDFYFNLNKAEIAELEFSQGNAGLASYLQKIVNAEDGKEILTTFKHIITLAVGRRGEDGRRFVKSQEIIDDFTQTEAYSQLFMEMVSDANAAAAFINGIVHSDIAEMIRKGETTNTIEAPVLNEPSDSDIPLYIQENREPTQKELQMMSSDEMRAAFQYRQNRNAT